MHNDKKILSRFLCSRADKNSGRNLEIENEITRYIGKEAEGNNNEKRAKCDMKARGGNSFINF